MASIKLRLDPNGYTSKKTGKVAIYLEYNHKNKRKLINTNVSCFEKDFDSDKEEIRTKGKSKEEVKEIAKVNGKIADLKNKINWILLDAQRNQVEPTVKHVVLRYQTLILHNSELDKKEEEILVMSSQKSRNVLIEQLKKSDDPLEKYDAEDPEDVLDFAEEMTQFYMSMRRFRKYYKHKYAHNSYKKIKTALRHVKNFDKKKELDFDKLNVEFFQNLEMYFVKKGLHPNTIGVHTRSIRSFINDSFRKKLHHNLDHRHYKIDETTPGIIVPTIQEVKAFYNCKFWSESEEVVKKLFVLNCFIGARFEDFMNFKSDNFGPDGISYLAEKTKRNPNPGTIFVPYLDITKEILEELGYKIQRFNNRSFNSILERIAKKSQLFERIVYDNVKEREVPLHQKIRSHTCRRVFCSMNANSSMNSTQAMSLSGHKTERHFKRYVVIEKGTLNDVYASLNEKIKTI